MSRRERESAILQIVAEEIVATQHDLVEALTRRGYDVTQATVSRDMKHLGLIKTPQSDGTHRYLPPEAPGPTPPAALDQFMEAFRSYAVGIGTGDALLVVRTRPGTAHTVAITIDNARLEGVAGTIAGDDTILLILKKDSDRTRVLTRMRDLIP